MSGILQGLLASISSAAAAVTDAYFNLVTLLLNTTATNGAQNNTFLDSSTNNFTITRNGNTTQGTFTPFSQTGWGNYFDGTDDRLTTSSALLAYSTGNASTQTATIEAMVYLNAYNASKASADENAAIVAKGSTYMSFCINHTGNLILYHYDGSVRTPTSSGTVPLNTWTHVAVTLSGGVATFYINGSSSGTGTWYGLAATSDPVYIGEATGASASAINGYLSNLRISTTARTISVPTAPYTSDASTALLTCQSNRFVDNSSNGYAVTVDSGTPSVQAFSPFAPTAAYDAAVVGGSGYFDGSADYLTTPSSSSFNLSSGDWTIEGWFWLNANSGDTRLFTIVNSSTDMYGAIVRSGTIRFGKLGVGEAAFGTINLNSWNHIAFSKNSTSTITCYINGISTGTTTSYTLPNADCTVYIAASPANYALSDTNGYISNFRIVKGTAVYTANFSVPTAPLTAITNTSLLLSGTNAGIFDSPSKNILETLGSAQVSTTQAKWGTTSMSFPSSSGNYLIGPPNQPNLLFGTGQYTIEAWIYPTAFTNVASGAFGYGLSGGYVDWNLEISTSGGALWIENDSVLFSASSNLSANVWTHVAIARTGSAVTLYYNGVSVGTSSTINNISGSSTSARLYVGTGAQVPGSRQFVGFIDDFRVTKGYARYTANFTPPTEAFPLQ